VKNIHVQNTFEQAIPPIVKTRTCFLELQKGKLVPLQARGAKTLPRI